MTKHNRRASTLTVNRNLLPNFSGPFGPLRVVKSGTGTVTVMNRHLDYFGQMNGLSAGALLDLLATTISVRHDRVGLARGLAHLGGRSSKLAD